MATFFSLSSYHLVGYGHVQTFSFAFQLVLDNHVIHWNSEFRKPIFFSYLPNNQLALIMQSSYQKIIDVFMIWGLLITSKLQIHFHHSYLEVHIHFAGLWYLPHLWIWNHKHNRRYQPFPTFCTPTSFVFLGRHLFRELEPLSGTICLSTNIHISNLTIREIFFRK